MAQNKKSGGVGGALLSVIIVAVLVAAGIWVARENNIKNLSDVWAFATKKSQQFDQCLPEDLVNNPTQIGCKVDANGNVVASDGSPIENSDNINDSSIGGQGTNESDSFTSTTPGVYWAINKGNSGGLGASSINQDRMNLGTIKEKLNTIGETLSADSIDSYHDKDFMRWVGTPCNTRDSIIRDVGVNVETNERCTSTTGTWVSPYDGQEITDANNISIDPIIPLEYAYQHGASAWDEQKRTEFANDKDNLVAVSSESATAKNKQSFANWLPENEEAHCDYAVSWVNVAYKYGITLDKADKDAITETLNKCS